jgi:hypothetical protein
VSSRGRALAYKVAYLDPQRDEPVHIPAQVKTYLGLGTLSIVCYRAQSQQRGYLPPLNASAPGTAGNAPSRVRLYAVGRTISGAFGPSRQSERREHEQIQRLCPGR